MFSEQSSFSQDDLGKASLPSLPETVSFSATEYSLLKQYFNKKDIEENRSNFRTILDCYTSSPRRVLYECSNRSYGWSPAFAASLAEQYGEFAPLLVSNLGSSTPYHVKKHAAWFRHLATDGSQAARRLTSSFGTSMLNALTPKTEEHLQRLPLEPLATVLLQFKSRGFFETKPDAVLNLIERYGSFTNALLRRSYDHGISGVLRYEKKHRAFLEALNDKPELQACFGSFLEERSLSNRALINHQKQILALCERYGTAAARWYQLKKAAIFKQAPEFYELLDRIQETLKRHDVGHAAGATFAALPRNASDHAETILSVIDSCKEYAANVLEHVSDQLLAKHGDSITHLASRCGAYSYRVMRAYVYNVPERVKDDTEYVHHILDHCSITSSNVFTYTNYYTFKNTRSGMMQAAERYGSLLGDLCHRWTSSVLDQEEQRRPFLLKLLDTYGELAGTYLTVVSPKQWESEFDTLYERHGAAAPRVIQGLARDYLRLETHEDFASYRDLRDRCREEFGITHVERLVTVDSDGQTRTLNDSLLRHALQNLDPEHNIERPIALVVLPETDHNRAFDTAAMKQGFHRLARNYKLFFVEVKTLDEITENIKRIGLLHGHTDDGDIARKIDFLLLCGHGAQQRIHLSTEISRVSENGNDSLNHVHQNITATDTDSFKAWEPYLEQDAIIGLISCRVACGGTEEDNIAMALHEALPNRAIDASRQASAFDSFICDSNGFVSALHYASTHETNVLRLRDNQAKHIRLNRSANSYEWHEAE